MTKANVKLALALAFAVAFGIRPSSFGIETDQLYLVLVAEDSRPDAPDSLRPIVDALGSGDARVRRAAVRALGRLERPSLVERIAPRLADPGAAVRREAANALGQSIGVRSAGAEDVRRVAALLTERLAAEPEPDVRGTLMRTLGRLDYRADDDVRAAERVLAAGLSASSLEEKDGAIRGLSRLFARRPDAPRVPAAETAAALRLIVRAGDAPTAQAGPNVRLRRVALQTLVASGTLDEETAAAAWRDRDWQVRRLTLQAGAGLVKGAAREREALNDPVPQVRFEGLRWLGQRDRVPCPAVASLLSDSDRNVARRAAATLRQTCDDGSRAVDRLATLAARPSRAAASDWHVSSTAIGSLAAVCTTAADVTRATAPCARVAEIVGSHAADPVWQVRMHAARPASLLGDRGTLRRLARDVHPNVREAAIEQLGALKARDDDELAIEALKTEDYQLIMTAARVLNDSHHPAAGSALRAAFDRLVARKSDTARDPLTALQASLKTRGVEVTLPSAVPRTPSFTPVELETLLAGDPHAVVTMTSGRSFELQLLPGEAPATVARFVRLARRGVYDGLTFHRVEPNFVIQGGSPGANEYAGHDPYMRDEVGLVSHDRGTVGISTRGRDTGDAQIFINLVDNPRLDHGYTVFARVVRGMDVVDAIAEGDAMARITIGQTAGPASRIGQLPRHQKRFSGRDFLQN